MAAILLDGEAVAARVRAEVADRVARLAHEGITVGLGTLLVGTDGPSERYVAMKHADCAEVGMVSVGEQLPATASQAEVEAVVSRFNADPTVNAYLVQLPLPEGLDEERVLLAVDPAKDVDGLHPTNLGRLVMGAPGPLPCTPAGIVELLAAYDVPVIEDAAEAVGATYRGKWAGRFGRLGVFSFNGNKIMTTSGGGMLVSSDPALIERAKKLATQARDPAPHYEHSELGFNYRMSDVLAGIGRAQLKSLPQRIRRRRQIFDHYRRALGDLAGVGFMPELPEGRGNRWLTCLTIDPAFSDIRPAAVLAALAADDIEARPLWKPLHRQPLYAAAGSFGGSVADELFSRGICLPSGSAMTEDDLNRVVAVIRGAFDAG